MKKLIITMLIVLSFSARADYDALKELQSSCGDLSNYSHIYGCNLKLYNEADESLNTVYNELIDYLKEKDRVNLRKAQRNWIMFRDSDCMFAEPRPEDKSIASANKMACLANRTLDRLKQLEWFNRGWNKGCNGCPW